MYTFIDNLEDLAFLNKELLSKPYVAVDTEFRRTTKDNMKLALLQVNDDEEIYLIDTIAIKDPKENASFLFSNNVTKIFHSCKEDLEAIYSWTNREMVNIFDTQIANALLNSDYSIGYQGLVEKSLGICLEKKETRSNWMKRPLSDDQLKYAALDVEYLIYLYKEQEKELLNTSKLEWLYQDIDRLIKITFHQPSFSADLERVISKAEELNLLNSLNRIVNNISEKKKINATLFFSKKAQKDFLRSVFIKGLDAACNDITIWRKELIKEDILNLLK